MLLPSSQSMDLPSLVRLRSLDKDSSNFDQSLDRAISIIGQPDGERHLDDAHAPQLFYSSSPRTEWLLCWLLRALKDDGAKGLSARSSYPAWHLLHQILLGVPPTVSTKLLVSHGFPSIVEKTLQGNFATASRDLEHQEEELKGAAEAGTHAKATRKRKRNGTQVQQQDRSSREYHNHRVLFKAVAETVIDIDNLATEASEALVLSQQVATKSVLLTDPAQATRLLRLWLESVHYLVSSLTGSDAIFPFDSLLAHVLQIWGASVTRLKCDSSSIAKQFSHTCLLPTIVLLSDVAPDLRTSGLLSADETGRDMKSQISRSLETHLAKHVFVPARTSFLAGADGRRASNRPDQSQDTVIDFAYLLRPLHAALAECASPGPLDADGRVLLKMVSFLLDIAVRSSPRPTPKQRLHVDSWLQHVFAVLCSCIRAPVDTCVPTRIDENRAAILDQMLDILYRSGVALDAEVLGKLVKSYAGVITPADGAAYFHQRLVSRVLHCDHTVFLDAPQAAAAGGLRLSDAIFRAITTAPTGGVNSSCNLVSATGFGSSTDTPRAEASDFLKNSIIVPLIKAYARVRDLAGFISRWFAQLEQLSQSGTSMERSIWVEKEVISAVRDVLESALTAKQIFDLLSEHWRRLSSTDVPPERAWLTQASASLVIVDALVGGLQSDETIASVVPVLQSLQQSLFVFSGVSGQPISIARALRTVSHIHIILRPHRRPQTATDFTHTVFSQATDHGIIDAIRAAEQSDAMDVGTRAEETFNLVATLCSDFTGALDLKEPAKDLFDQSTSALFRSNQEIKDKIMGGAKRRRTADVPDAATARLEAFTLNAAAVITQYPSLLTLPPLESLKGLIRLLFWHAFGEFSGHYEAPRGLSYTVVFEAMSDIILTLPSSELRDLLFSVFYEALDPGLKPEKSRHLGERLSAFAEIQYLRVPVAAIGRKHRQRVLDWVMEMCTLSGKRRPDADAFVRHMSLAVKFMEVSNAKSELATEPDLLWTVAGSMQDNKLADSHTLKLLDELVRLTLRDVIDVKEQERGQQYLEGYRKLMRRFAREATTFRHRVAELSCFKVGHMTLVSSDQLWDDEETYKTMKRYLRTLDADLELLVPGALCTMPAEDDVFVRSVLAAISDLPIREMVREGYICSMEARLLKCVRKRSSLDQTTAISQPAASIWVSLATALANVASSTEAECVSDMIYHLWCCDLSAADRHNLLEATRRALGSLGLEKKTSLLLQSKFSPDDERNWQPTLVLMNILISSLPDVPSKSDESTKGLNGFLGQLSDYLDNAEAIRNFHAALNCADTILREKHWLVSQCAIERIISSLARIASPSSVELPAEHADAIYTRLCGTTHLILALHRTRLGGRFHVLVPLLQNLLACLFTPARGRRDDVAAYSPPPWLAAADAPLAPAQASSFARLITTLCNPTTSAVKGPLNRKRPASMSTSTTAELVDETKKAREYTGQYVPALLASFCTYSLHGRIDPETRAALMPAVYACADVVDIEAMRAMNASLPAAERAVWRDVYADWTKFGRWDGK